MATLNNPMGALRAVGILGAVQADRDSRQSPGMLADWRCMRDHPVLSETWQRCREWCREWCRANHPDKPCAVSCFYGSDGRGGCALKANCTECSEALDLASDLTPAQR